MPRAIAINSRSTGKYWQAEINGRPHMLTTMVSIEGDSVMNSLFYPVAEVTAAHKQLDRLPAPASHPVVNGAFVSAYDPLAVNAHNVGGLVLNPRMEGKQVLNDLAFDVEVAERDERGQEILNRIKGGERIGVSTGLTVARVSNTSGLAAGKPYSGTVSGLEFDHVAVLLDEDPAGDNTFTINAGETDRILLCNIADSVNELRDEIQAAADKKWSGAWTEDILLDPPRAIVSTQDADGAPRLLEVPYSRDPTGAIVFTGEGDIVTRKVIYEPLGQPAPETSDMDKAKLILALLANANNGLSAADAPRLEAMDELQLAGLLSQPPTLEQATAIVMESGSVLVNTDAFDEEGYAEYVANKAAFEAFQAAEVTKRQGIVDAIVANSKSTAEDLADLSDDALQRMAESLTPAPDFSAAGSPVTNAGRTEPAVDYS